MIDAANVHALDAVFHAIMRQLVETGRASHYAELARIVQRSPEEIRLAIHAIFDRGYPGWMHPGTDLIASFPPFNSLPTAYRISVRGAQKWFGQCGFEALAASWLFPGQTVRIEAPCLDCAEPMVLELRDGRPETVDPPTIVGHCNSPWSMLTDPRNLPLM